MSYQIIKTLKNKYNILKDGVIIGISSAEELAKAIVKIREEREENEHIREYK